MKFEVTVKMWSDQYGLTNVAIHKDVTEVKYASGDVRINIVKFENGDHIVYPERCVLDIKVIKED